MLSRVNGVVWMEEEGDSVSWNRDAEKPDELSLSTFKSMLEDDWNGYLNPSNHNPSPHDSAVFQTLHSHTHLDIKDLSFPPNPSSQDNLLLQPIESSSSLFSLDPSRAPPFVPPKNCLSSLLNAVCNNPFDAGFDLGCDMGLFPPPTTAAPQSNSSVLMNRGVGVLQGFNSLGSNGQMGAPDLGPSDQIPSTRLLSLPENAGLNLNPMGFPCFDGVSGNSNSPLFPNRPKVLRPLEISPPVGVQPTLFQKRAALRQNSPAGAEKIRNLGALGLDGRGGRILPQADGRRDLEEGREKRRKCSEEDEFDDASIDGSGLNYDSDEAVTENPNKGEENMKNGGNNSNANSTVTCGDQKGKKKGLPAKNLMAERRRRKKLNDRLLMLRSIILKISKSFSWEISGMWPPFSFSCTKSTAEKREHVRLLTTKIGGESTLLHIYKQRRRDRINEKMRSLQELIPNCNKVDKASMLDEAIEYLKTLQMQVQIMSMGTGLCMPPMMLPARIQNLRGPAIPHFPHMGVGMGMGIGMRFGMGMPDMGCSSSYPLIPMPQMHGPQFPCSSISGPTSLHGLPSSSLQMFGIPGQGLPLSLPCAPFIPLSGFATKPPSAPDFSVAACPVPVLDSAPPSSSKDQIRDISQQTMHKTSIECLQTQPSTHVCAVILDPCPIQLIKDMFGCSELTCNNPIQYRRKFTMTTKPPI